MLKSKLITILSIAFFALSFNVSKAECSLNFNNLSINNQTNTDKADIVRLQTILYINELYDGPITGYYGNLTEKAINFFKNSRGLKADGIVDNKTINVLCDNYTLCPFESNLKKDDEHPVREIKSIQSFLRLIPNIYPERLVTGYFGSKTENAVKRLQKQLNISQTGRMDLTTRDSFCSFFNSFESSDIPVTSSADTTSIFQALCLAFPKQVKAGENVLFISQILGGSSPYKYVWNSKDTNNDKTFKTVFSKSGNNVVTLKVVDSKGKIANAKCSVDVTGGVAGDDSWEGISMNADNEYKTTTNKIKMSVDKTIIKTGDKFVINWSTGDIPAYFCRFSSNNQYSTWSKVNLLESLPGKGKEKYDVTSGKFDASYGFGGLLKITGSTESNLANFYRIDCLEKNNSVISAILYVEKDKKPILVYDGDANNKPSSTIFPNFISRDEFGTIVEQMNESKEYFAVLSNVSKALTSNWESYFLRFLTDFPNYTISTPAERPFLEDWIQIWTNGGENAGSKVYKREMIFVYPIFDGKMVRLFEKRVDLGWGNKYNQLIPRIRKSVVRIEDGQLVEKNSYIEKNVKFNYFMGQTDRISPNSNLWLSKTAETERQWKQDVLDFMKGKTSFPGLNYQLISLEIEDNMGADTGSEEVSYILDYFSGNSIYKSEVLDTYKYSKIVKEDVSKVKESIKKIFSQTNPLKCKLGDLGVRKECDSFFRNANICSITLGKSFDMDAVKNLPNCLSIDAMPAVSFK